MKDRGMIDNLIVEVTRRCNFRCEHCLRGEPEKLDLDEKLLEPIFRDCSYVGTLTFSGGEPSLVVPVIRRIRLMMERMETGYGSFYIATNGTGNNKPKFVLELMQLWLRGEDNEVSAVDVSNSIFHKDGVSTSLGLLSALRFASLKESKETRGKWTPTLIREGRAVELAKRGHVVRDAREEKFEVEDGRVEGEVYVNCEGNVVMGCDWSYESQRRAGNIFSTTKGFWAKARRLEKARRVG